MDGATFSVPAVGARLLPTTSDVALRSEVGGEVLRLLGPAEFVVVTEVVGEATVVSGRRDVWLRVSTSSGESALVFGADVTILAAPPADAQSDGTDDTWAVSFDASFQPQLTYTTAIMEDGQPSTVRRRSQTLRLSLTDRFSGGTLHAEGQFMAYEDPEVRVTQCPPPGVDPSGVGCVTGRVRAADRGVMVQVTLPDSWENDITDVDRCEEGPAVRPELGPVRERVRLNLLKHMRSGDELVVCSEIGTLPGGALVSCARTTPRKVFPTNVSIWRFLDRGDGRWTYLPCAGDRHDDDPMRPFEVESLARELGGQRIRVDVDPTVRFEGPLGPPPPELPVARGRLVYAWRAPRGPEAPVVLTDDATVGPLLGATAPRDWLAASAYAVPVPTEGALLYRWEPAGPQITWDEGREPVKPVPYRFEEADCSWSGYPLRLDLDVGPRDVIRVGQLPDGSVVSTLAESHPAAQRVLGDFQEMRSASRERGALPPTLADVPVSGVWAHRPTVWVEDPWGRFARLRREDFELTMGCEPYVYVYGEPGSTVSVSPVPPLEWFHTVPSGRLGWVGEVRRDGRVRVGDRWYDALLWEGTSGWVPPPRQAWVVRGDEVEGLLRSVAPVLGLRGREAEGFVEAWASLAEVPWVRVGFHDAATLDRRYPVAVSPPPTEILRVMVDFTLLDEPVDALEPELTPAEVDRTEGLVVVEWGGIVRERRQLR